MKLKNIVRILVAIACLGIEGGGAHAATPTFDPGTVKKIYYLLLSSTGVGRSSFGHGYLRVSSENTPSMNDDIVEFVADGQVTSVWQSIRALGVIGTPYVRSVHVQKYAGVMQQENFISNRTFTSYELKLSDEQRTRLVTRLNEVLERGQFGNYGFFTENCASAIKEIFSDASLPLDRGISGSIPSAIPGLLRDAGLIGEVSVDEAVEDRRQTLLTRYQGPLSATGVELKNLVGPLVSADLSQRMLAYTQLASQAESAGSRPISDYLRAAAFLESRIVRQDILDLVHGQPGLKTSFVGSVIVDLSLEGAATFSDVHVKKQRIEGMGAGYQVAFDLALDGSDGRGNPLPLVKTVRMALPGLSRNERSELIWNGAVVGIATSKSLFKADVLLSSVFFFPFLSRIADRQWSLSVFSLMDRTHTAPRALDSAESGQMIPFKNNDPARPSCNSMTDFQKAILQRIFFDEAGTRLSQERSLELIEAALGGAIVVVPGFANAQAWIASLDGRAVRDTLFRYQSQNYRSVVGALENWWDSKSLTTEDLMEIGRVGRLGYPTQVYQRVQGASGHSLLIVDVIDEGAKLRLVAYDPNLGFVKDLFHFDKRTQKSDLVVYPRETLMARRVDLERDMTDQALMGPAGTSLLIWLSRQNHVYVASPSMLSSVY